MLPAELEIAAQPSVVASELPDITVGPGKCKPAFIPKNQLSVECCAMIELLRKTQEIISSIIFMRFFLNSKIGNIKYPQQKPIKTQ